MDEALRLEHLLASEEVILSREHPSLGWALRRHAQRGRLARILPGTFCDPGRERDLRTRALAVCRWDPRAVIVGRAAAALTYWTQLPVGTIDVASLSVHRAQPGFRFTERRVPPDLVLRRGPVAMTVPSLTAVDLATLEFTDPIDVALRKKQACLLSLQEALEQTPKRRGNRQRWRVLLESRAEPWSAAERLAHRIYRRAGITGWVTNLRVQVPDGDIYFLDIAFRGRRVASEVDGFEHHTSRAVFESDRLRQNALLLDRWLMMRFTYLMLSDEEDYVVETTRRALARRARNSGFTGRSGWNLPSWSA